jgi:hypothetical protein
MKMDENISESKARPFFRVIAFVLGLIFFLFGCGGLILLLVSNIRLEDLFHKGNSIIIVSIFLGILFLKVAISGQAKKIEKKNTLLTDKKPGRFILLLELLFYVFIISLVVIIFRYTHWTNTWWWMGLLILLGLLARFIAVSYVLLTSRGYNPWLAATIVLPVYLMLKLTIKPEQ